MLSERTVREGIERLAPFGSCVNRRFESAMKHVIGMSAHTGWGACVVVGGTLAKPQIVAEKLAAPAAWSVMGKRQL